MARLFFVGAEGADRNLRLTNCQGVADDFSRLRVHRMSSTVFRSRSSRIAHLDHLVGAREQLFAAHFTLTKSPGPRSSMRAAWSGTSRRGPCSRRPAPSAKLALAHPMQYPGFGANAVAPNQSRASN